MVLFSRESESQWITLRLEEDYKKNQKKKRKERKKERERERVNRKLESNLKIKARLAHTVHLHQITGWWAANTKKAG